MRRALPLALLLSACATDGALEPGAAPDAVVIEPEALQVLGIERVGYRGPMVDGTVIDLLLVVRGDGAFDVQWSTSGGEIAGDGISASWVLPPQEEATVRVMLTPHGDQEPIEAAFLFPVGVDKPGPQWAVSPLATGLADPTDDSISSCQLAIDSNDVPHVLYRSSTHAQLWYAKFVNSAWDIQFVDGPGFDVGGLIANQFDLAVNSSGTPHAVYRYTTGSDIQYATLSGNTWTRETVNSTYQFSNPSGSLGIALDPLNGNRATVGYSHYHAPGNDDYPVMAYRASPGNWTEDAFVGTSCCNWFAGGIAFTASGVAYVTYSPTNARIVNWSASQGFFDDDVFDTSFGYSDYLPVRLDNLNQPITMSDEAVYHRVNNTWVASPYEQSDTGHFDLAVDGSGEPVMAIRHGSELELIDTNAEGYWQYDPADDMDSSAPSVAVDSSGNTHACYVKGSEIWFW